MSKKLNFSHKRRKWLDTLVASDKGLVCEYCGMIDLIIRHEEDPDIPKNRRATIDHVISINNGGSRMSINNWVVACQLCNGMKGYDER